MSKKKKHSEEEEAENSERWLLTYADMITLLLALFIILYSMSTVNAKKVAEIAKSFGYAMGTASEATEGEAGDGIYAGSTGAGAPDETEADAAAAAAGIGIGTGAEVSVDALDEIYTTLSEYISEHDLEGSVELENTETYVKIQLKDMLMFNPDSSVMLSESEPVMEKIGSAIQAVYDKVDHITISGHTAEVGEQTMETRQFSWRLSTERAVTVLNELIAFGLTEDKLSIEGYSHFSPVANNNTEDGRAKNRRVEITIYKYPAGVTGDSETSGE